MMTYRKLAMLALCGSVLTVPIAGAQTGSSDDRDSEQQQKQSDKRSGGSMTDALGGPLGGTGTGATGGSLGSGPDASTDGLSTGDRSVSFGGLDVNGDGKLSRDEIRANPSVTGRFDQLDSDRNGSLSTGEFSAFESGGSGTSGSGRSGSDSDTRPLGSTERDDNSSTPGSDGARR